MNILLVVLGSTAWAISICYLYRRVLGSNLVTLVWCILFTLGLPAYLAGIIIPLEERIEVLEEMLLVEDG